MTVQVLFLSPSVFPDDILNVEPAIPVYRSVTHAFIHWGWGIMVLSKQGYSLSQVFYKAAACCGNLRIHPNQKIIVAAFQWMSLWDF